MCNREIGLSTVVFFHQRSQDKIKSDIIRLSIIIIPHHASMKCTSQTHWEISKGNDFNATCATSCVPRNALQTIAGFPARNRTSKKAWKDKRATREEHATSVPLCGNTFQPISSPSTGRWHQPLHLLRLSCWFVIQHQRSPCHIEE